jgi:three-Cys-motif partner protein
MQLAQGIAGTKASSSRKAGASPAAKFVGRGNSPRASMCRCLSSLRKLAERESEACDKKGKKLSRKVEIIHADFNRAIETILDSNSISQKEATFCLLDQRTFECHWATLERLAKYKQPPNNKIELLYLLGVGWIHRAFSGIRDNDKLRSWWGRSDWESLRDMSAWDMVQLARSRFEKELGYRFAAAYPIYDRDEGNRVMYYMIHGSDHEEAPALMVRAHRNAVRTLAATQGDLPFTTSPDA